MVVVGVVAMVGVELWGRVEFGGRGTLGERGAVGCELCGLGFLWVIRWWSLACLVVYCGGVCCVFGGWWLWVVDYGSDMVFVLFFNLGLWVWIWQWW